MPLVDLQGESFNAHWRVAVLTESRDASAASFRVITAKNRTSRARRFRRVTASCVEPKHNVHDVGLTLRSEGEPALRKHRRHCVVLWQDVGDQLPEPGAAGNPGEMAHQGRTDPLSLIRIDDGEGYLGLPGLQDDVTCTADDHRPAGLLHHGDEGHVIDEVDVEEVGRFLLREAALHIEEAAVEGLEAGAADRGQEFGPVILSEGPDIDPTSIAKRLDRRIRRCFHHGRPSILCPRARETERE